MDDRAKWRALIETDFSASLMNDTKWERLLAGIDSIPMHPHFRVKVIDGPEPTDSWERSWPYHLPTPYLCIEWLDLSPLIRRQRGQLVADEITDRSPELERAIRAAGVQFTREGHAFRIWGHLRPGTSPDFEK